MRKAILKRLRRSRRLQLGALVCLAATAALTGTVLGAGAFSANDNPWPYAAPEGAPVLAAVGDVACQPGAPVEAEKQKDVCDKTGTGYTTRLQAQAATAEEIEKMKPDLVAVLGDEQYEVGRYEDFMGSFDKTYGAFKFLQRPAPGNHEFYSEHGETGVHGDGYFDYYNGFQHNPADGSIVNDTFSVEEGPEAGAATFTQPRPRQDGQAGRVGENGDGWYSYNLGSWHLISLNAECEVQPGGCQPNGSWFASETRWLARDLAADHAPCTLAYWHQPTFSVAAEEADPEGKAADSWWQLLYQHGADIVLNGHDHTYARYAPMNPNGEADPTYGIREFIVGTGGESLDQPVINANTPNLQAATGDYYGVMALRLGPSGYSWDYESAMKSPEAPAGTPAGYSDTGSAGCH
jgi:Calcineurin-like phosphoesterase